ncbi:MAG: BMP family ABC transporter substrate-binding protein [Oscillospiraceae bacterium]|nr:BMP family ABC transporter substrate-binding protein [Oscillospiraceae bacterium]
MKKILALALALCMIFALAACGQSAAPAATEAAPAEEAAPAAEAAPAEEAAVVKIGMVTDVGGVNDKSFNQTSWEGLQALAAEDPSFEVNYLESKTDADYQTNINTFIDEGYDLVICVGYMLADATREAAEANPDQLFAIIDDASIDLPNVACLMFAQEQASYLVGLVAGSVTESKTVGYVQGMVSDSMNLFGIGYITGVLEACPDATVLQYNANNFGDSAGGSTAAKDMITKGADVIYHAAGGTGMGVIEACNEEGIWAIGVDTDQSILAPDHVITSAMKRVDVASQDISKAVKDGAFTAGVHMYDLSNGGVDLAPTRDHIPAEVLEVVEAAKAAIINGEKTVPTTTAECPAFTLG